MGETADRRRSGRRRAPRRASTDRRRAIVGISIAAAVVLIAAFVVTARLTDASGFCRSCHEMQPYYQAWSVGMHQNVQCVDCHVLPGEGNRLAHKLVALGEVWAHVTGDTRFPRPIPPGAPDQACKSCHNVVNVRVGTTSRFSHTLHASKAPCWQCHATAGHEVPLSALATAGVLAANARPVPASVVGTSAPPRAGHIAVSCTRCHDQSKMACSTCHVAPHKPLGDACQQCHRPGTAFSFVHPTSGECSACHTPKHPPRGRCTLCHKPGPKWVFYHPASQDCAKCHKPKHAPRGPCATCHRVGSKWVFYHPTAKDCTRCHKPPANHFGPDCAACHHPGTPFARTTFSHPDTGAPHGYTDFPCADCHPNNPPAVSCTCHGGGRPSGD